MSKKQESNNKRIVHNDKENSRFKRKQKDSIVVDCLNQFDKNIVKNKRQKHDAFNHDVATTSAEKDSMAADNKFENNEIKWIHLGNKDIATCYHNKYAKEFHQTTIWICDICLNYFKQKASLSFHMSRCDMKHPPGNQVYHKESLSIWEVDSSDYKLYCQNLCLLAKLFIDDKFVCYDIERFLFYVLVETNKYCKRLIGYFSKEKRSTNQNNVACVLILPPFQKKGYGNLLIAFSYELSRLEGVVASPEKPLSDLGKLAYLSYWSRTVLELIEQKRYRSLPIKYISEKTSITQTDIISALKHINIIKYKQDNDTICVQPDCIKKLLNSKYFAKPKLVLDRESIRWTEKSTIFK